MKCSDFRELIDSYLSDELLTETNHGVLRHLEQCVECRTVIEERREFRARLRSAVVNSKEFAVDEEFIAALSSSMRASILPQRRPAAIRFWNIRFSLVAATAVGLLVVFGLGFVFLQKFEGNPPADLAQSDKRELTTGFQQVALADHKMCAVDHDLPRQPLKIDLSAAQNASLQKGVVQPLESAAPGEYELIASHFCEVDGQSFAHLIYRHEGNVISVQVTDLPENEPRNGDLINNLSLQGYQIARFDVNKKAVFVISDMPESQNATTAEILEQPMRKELSGDLRSWISEFGTTGRGVEDLGISRLFINHRNTQFQDA